MLCSVKRNMKNCTTLKQKVQQIQVQATVQPRQQAQQIQAQAKIVEQKLAVKAVAEDAATAKLPAVLQNLPVQNPTLNLAHKQANTVLKLCFLF